MIDTKGLKPFIGWNEYLLIFKYARIKIIKYLNRSINRKITRATITENSNSEVVDKTVLGKVYIIIRSKIIERIPLVKILLIIFFSILFS
jgi:hypothetical protein